jgi:hypothetical protein
LELISRRYKYDALRFGIVFLPQSSLVVPIVPTPTVHLLPYSNSGTGTAALNDKMTSEQEKEGMGRKREMA